MTGKILILATLVALTSCTTVSVQPTLPCPNRPTLAAFVAEELESMTPSAQKKAADNQILLKAYGKKLETRAGCAR
jgi:hypothetical protein